MRQKRKPWRRRMMRREFVEGELFEIVEGELFGAPSA
jgi:hypothetical protein